MVESPIQTIDWQALRDAEGPGVDVHRIVGHKANLPHDHLFHEIVYVEAGSALHRTAGEDRKLRPGDVIVLRPQVWHFYAQPRDLTIINCLIDGKLIHRFGSLLAQVSTAFELFSRRPIHPRDEPPVVLHATPAAGKAILDRLDLMMHERRERRDGWRAAVTVHLMEVLIATARLALPQEQSAQTTTPATRAEQAVFDAVAYVEAHFDETIQLRDVARRVHLSEGHLSRSFSRRMGMGLIEFVHRLRAEEACRLLRSTQDSIADIAGAVGYDEVAYFSRCFRSQIGVSPRAYRNARPR